MSSVFAADGLCRSVVLRRRPEGEPRPEHFEVVEQPVPALGAGEVLTRTLWLSIDPYMRGRLADRASYVAPVPLGGVMDGESVGAVLASNDPRFVPGNLVLGSRGWQTHSVSPAARLVRLDRDGPAASTYLGVLGMPGTTAYSGMTDIGQARAGETVVVSAAAGPVGSVAGQIARRAGARVVGVAGGAEKCRWVRETLGFDDCVDHRSGDPRAALASACPAGVDVYFENVGGAVQAAAFALLNPFARVIMCGMVAEYIESVPSPGPNLMFVVGKRVRIQGLIVSDRPERFAQWRALATPWVKEGSLKYRECIVDGLENAPEALARVLRGGNFGKMLVRVTPDA